MVFFFTFMLIEAVVGVGVGVGVGVAEAVGDGEVVGFSATFS
jgi:hypothetical protein